MVAADLIAVADEAVSFTPLKIMGMGFDVCLYYKNIKEPAFKEFFKRRLARGNRRLAGLIQEEEYRRFSDALSCAPASIVVFDADKRLVFVSEHYYRAYPKSAHRLRRGLSVYEAFDMMSREEKFPDKDPRYEGLKKFWYSLEGSYEFTHDSGKTYRLKAAKLPNGRGTIVTGTNITDYIDARKNDHN